MADKPEESGIKSQSDSQDPHENMIKTTDAVPPGSSPGSAEKPITKPEQQPQPQAQTAPQQKKPSWLKQMWEKAELDV